MKAPCTPAFPQSFAADQNGYMYTASDKYGEIVTGMTLRDYFAGQALEGMLAHSRNNHGYQPRNQNQPWHEAISEEVYQLADAMLFARSKE